METHTPVRFETNIDCCKRFMKGNSNLALKSINPQVGDTVRVYHDSEFELWMPVVSRRWYLTNGSTPVLICELGCPSYFKNLFDFIEMMKNRGFN